jgi:hypothetical protein
VNLHPLLSAFGDFSAYFLHCNLLKTQGVPLVFDLHFPFSHLQEIEVIIFALLAAVIVLVAVTFISSIDFSSTRRR